MGQIDPWRIISTGRRILRVQNDWNDWSDLLYKTDRQRDWEFFSYPFFATKSRWNIERQNTNKDCDSGNHRENILKSNLSIKNKRAILYNYFVNQYSTVTVSVSISFAVENQSYWKVEEEAQGIKCVSIRIAKFLFHV